MNELNFTNEYYKKVALNSKFDVNKIHSEEDAFFLLINGLEINDLDNFCTKIKTQLSIDESIEKIYDIIQNPNNLDSNSKITLYNIALDMVNNNQYLGTKTIQEGKINTSSWINHAINVSTVCKNLATSLNLDSGKAASYGMLHDFGRKYSHKFNHAVLGFEKLVDLGFEAEALGCLTHSFVKGGRCANNEVAVDGFYIDENGLPQWKADAKKDDITFFLENYQYSDYDILLNIADLMATSENVLEPFERLEDIKTRRTIDPTNRTYFLVELINMLNKFLYDSKLIENYEHLDLDDDMPLEKVEDLLKDVSKLFFHYYKNINVLAKTK